MYDHRAIATLYARRRRLALGLERIEKQAASYRATIAEIEAELQTHILFVPPPVVPRRPRMPFAARELARLCLDALREAGRPVYAADVSAYVLGAKGADPADRELKVNVARRVTMALWRMEKRGRVRKAGAGRGMRWSLPG